MGWMGVGREEGGRAMLGGGEEREGREKRGLKRRMRTERRRVLSVVVLCLGGKEF